MSDRAERTVGPYIRWLDYGLEGWQPDSFPTLKAALNAESYSSFVLTRLVDYEVTEKPERDVVQPAVPEAAVGGVRKEPPASSSGPVLHFYPDSTDPELLSMQPPGGGHYGGGGSHEASGGPSPAGAIPSREERERWRTYLKRFQNIGSTDTQEFISRLLSAIDTLLSEREEARKVALDAQAWLPRPSKVVPTSALQNVWDRLNDFLSRTRPEGKE